MSDDEDGFMDNLKEGMNESDGLLNAMGHMAGMRQRDKTNKEIRELKQVITQQQQKEASLPKCPWCAGPIEPNVFKCRHCSSDIEWVKINGPVPCRPQDKDETIKAEEARKIKLREMQKAVEKKRQEKEAGVQSGEEIEYGNPIIGTIVVVILFIAIVLVIVFAS